MTTKLIKVTDTTLRDAHQSLFATRFNNSTISKLAPVLDKVGYDVLEVWGGATFDSCIRYLNEDPWDRLKMIKRLAPNTNLSMLIRGANLVGYRHYSEEIINEFVSVSADFGIDIFRLFDALNDPDNLETASKAIKNKNKHLQLAICYSTGESGKLETKSTEIYTLNYYINLAKTFVTMGADSLCIKDMAGLLFPYDAYMLITELKNNISIPIQLHNHYTSGLASMTQLKAIEADAYLINCCGANFVTEGIKTLNNLTDKPIGGYANSVLVRVSKNTKVKDATYSMEKNPEQAQRSLSKNIDEWDYSSEAKKWLKNGASIIGGCCSTTPNHIKEIKKITD